MPRHEGPGRAERRRNRAVLRRGDRLAQRRPALSDRERLAAEFAERFAIDHLAMDDELWGRLHAAFSEDELADLTICCGCFLGMGRALAVVGVRAPDERILV